MNLGRLKHLQAAYSNRSKEKQRWALIKPANDTKKQKEKMYGTCQAKKKNDVSP
jgi:hypothetical protein